MHTLYLLRHAKSSWADPALPDYQRPLAPRGLRDVKRIARHLVRLGIEPELVLCSSAERTRETLELIRPALGATAHLVEAVQAFVPVSRGRRPTSAEKSRAALGLRLRALTLLLLDAGAAGGRGKDARVAVLPVHLVARRLLLQHLLDHTPPASRVGSLRLDHNGVTDLPDHGSETSAWGDRAVADVGRRS
jgi:broad specificity phosphatase PhoE